MANINNFLTSGELGHGSAVLVYLDVEANTALSPAYWAGWANAIRNAKAPLGDLPYFPGIYTQFVKSSDGLYYPNSDVQYALNNSCNN